MGNYISSAVPAEQAELEHDMYSSSAAFAAEERQREIHDKALEIICNGPSLADLDTEWYLQGASDIARMIRNLPRAMQGEQHANDAIVQALLNLRNICYDGAVAVLEGK